jgi:hypothetical protein
VSRSVSYLTNAELVLYAEAPKSEDENDQWLWDDVVSEFKATMCEAFPSLNECSAWGGREDHIILRNRLAEFAISEYCGLVAISARPTQSDYSGNTEALKSKWLRQAGTKTRKAVRDCFGGTLALIGRASNGEAFFNREN